MDDKEKLIALRVKTIGIYDRFGCLFTDTPAGLRDKLVKQIADQFHESNNLYKEVSHRIDKHPLSVATPLLSVDAKSFAGGAVDLAAHCHMLGDILVEQIETHEGRLTFAMERDYYRMLSEAVEVELDQAIVKIDNPKAKFPPFSFKVFMPSHFVLRSDLCNKGSKKGLLGISSGRLTQLQQRPDNPFPKPLIIQGRVETYIMDEVEAWEIRESEKKKR